MDELYVEDFSSPAVKEEPKVVREAPSPAAQVIEVSAAEPPTPMAHFEELKKAIDLECQRPEMVLPYLKDIEEALEKGKEEEALKLTDDLEELLDIALFSS